MDILRDLNKLAKEVFGKYTDNFKASDCRLPQVFKEKVQSLKTFSLVYNNYSVIIKGDGVRSKDSYVPNQCFFMASFFIEYALELSKYKQKVISLITNSGVATSDLTDFFTHERDNGKEDVANGNDKFVEILDNAGYKEVDRDYLIRFVTDYYWWSGSKTIERSDFFNSPVLSIMGLTASSNAAMALIVDYLTQNPEDNSLLLQEIENSDTFSNNNNSKYRPFITAIKSKPFLLLAGISGTGKSRIVRELARACWDDGDDEYKAQKPSNFEMVQVKPNWHDSSELVGYVSRVSGEPIYVAGEFLKFIAKAWENLEIPYFLCLDEMNLAPVEQYFAEYLSVVESRKVSEDGVVITDPILKKSEEDWFRVLTGVLTSDDVVRNRFLTEGICIPQNLIVIGTVNMDETTFSFSRKVLDRAMTIEMNEVNLHGGLENRYERIGKLGKTELISNAVEGVDVYSTYKDICDIVIEFLKHVNRELEGTPFKIAYRTRNEVLLYVVNNLPYDKDAEGNSLSQNFVIARALDEITNMKILSRIEGDETKVCASFLDGLVNTIETGLVEICQDLFEEGEGKKAYVSVSLAKLTEMKKRLASGYTSFWS